MFVWAIVSPALVRMAWTMIALSSFSLRHIRHAPVGEFSSLLIAAPAALPLAAASEQTATVLVSKVTAPLRASIRPDAVALVLSVIEVSASIVPNRFELVPRVAELPTCQKQLHACAPLMSTTLLLEAVMSVDA